MKKYLSIIIFTLIIIFGFNSEVKAKNVSKECNYTYVYELYANETTESAPYSEGGTITLKIYDDGSQDGIGKDNGELLSDDFGGNEKIINWGKSDREVPDIKGSECPAYIGVANFWGNDHWYGFAADKLMEYGKSLAAKRGKTLSIRVLKLDDLNLDTPTYKCSYQGYEITVDTNQKKISGGGIGALSSVIYIPHESLTELWFSTVRGTDECLDTVSCYGQTAGQSAIYYIFNDELEAQKNGYDNCSVKSCQGDDCNEQISSSCITYKSYLDKIDNLYGQIESSQSTEKSKLYTDVNRKIDELSNLCNSLTSSYNYSSICVQACLNFSDDLKNIKKNHNIDYEVNNANSCGISERIINWILKILKWIRYGVPILVIVLGGIDFTKAIASDSDDEIKKAGGRFVKRLIAAALIFLVPLLLEFILSIFGYTTNNFCI